MKEEILKLKPQNVWKIFYEISQIPRESKKEEKIRKYIKNFAKQHKLKSKEDKIGNILIEIPATEGLEDKPTIIIQSHMDMVAEKEKNSDHNFEKDPLQLYIDNGWVTAKQTTLGADNGIGMASALAIIQEKIKHPQLKLLFTVDEETGLTGASMLEPEFLEANILLNLDSEEEGVFFIGCAGGANTIAFLPKKTIPADNLNYLTYQLKITGLKGGHSGVDIHRGRANAIKILARLFKKLESLDLKIAEINGGNKINAIPRESEAIILIKEEEKNKITEVITQLQADLYIEYQISDPNIQIILEKTDKEIKTVFSQDFQKTIINTLLSLPHGLISLCQDLPELVETSSNLARICTKDTTIEIHTSQRSSIDSALGYIIQSVTSIFNLAGAITETNSGYPGWKPNIGSPIVLLAEKVYKNLYKKSPQIKAVHAGLECGLIGKKNPNLDMISFGPTIIGAHSPSEKVEIKSVEKFYKFLLALIKEISK